MQNLDLLAHGTGELLTTPVGRLADDLFTVFPEGAPHTRPAAAAVGIGLVEYSDAPAADGYEVIDQAFGFLTVGCAQIEGKFPIRRLPLRLSPGERKEEEHLFVLEFLQERQNPRYGRRTDIAEQREHLIVQRQLYRVFDTGVRLITIVVGLEDNLAAVDAAGAIDMVETGHGATIEFNTQPP